MAAGRKKSFDLGDLVKLIEFKLGHTKPERARRLRLELSQWLREHPDGKVKVGEGFGSLTAEQRRLWDEGC